MLIFSDHLFRIFSTDPQVLAIGPTYLRVGALTAWAYLILNIHIATLQGMKHPMYAFVIGCFRQILAPILVFYVVTRIFEWELFSVWWSVFVITWIAAIITIVYTRSVIKKRKSFNTLKLALSKTLPLLISDG